MCEKNISENPSFKKLEKDLNQLKLLKAFYPLIKPFLNDVSKIEKGLNKIPELEQTLHELKTIPDKFNNLFSDHGWIFNELLSIEKGKQAIKAYEEHSLEKAENILVNYYSPEWVENHLVLLTFLPEFKERVELAKKACEDYKAGRYYSSVLVTILLIDGWVNDLNIVDFQRKGFYAEDSPLIAWDSITAHSKGLVKLQKVFCKGRKKTVTEKITIPYRHGIIHGMDLGFDNKIVAAKNWAALFSVRDWVIKARKGELKPPPAVKEKELSWIESIQGLIDTKNNIEKFKNWKPRDINIAIDYPSKGRLEDYPDNTPEKTLISFLEYWKNDNYGFMAKCYAPMFNKKPIEIRQEYHDKTLIDYELIEIKDLAPCTTQIITKAILEIEGNRTIKIFEFRLICNTKEGEMVYIQSDNSIWGIIDRKEINK